MANDIILSIAPEKFAIFVSGEIGVIKMQETLKESKMHQWREGKISQEEYDNPNGIFLCFVYNNSIYSGIIQAENSNDSKIMLLDIPLKLHEEGMDLKTILRLPMDRIPLFPFFTILNSLQFGKIELINELKRQYWSNFTEDVEALKNWYLDYVRFKREVINKEAPQLEFSIPYWLENLEIYVLYNEEERIIATAYYSCPENKDDVVFVKKITNKIRFGIDKYDLFSNFFTLPAPQYIISRTTSHSKVGEKAFSDWNHPYFAAVEELEKEVKNFNKAQPSFLYEAYSSSPSLIYNWTYQEIQKRRELTDKFHFLKETFKHWCKPVQVLIRYFIEEPKKNWITDGIINGYYVNGPDDRIIVKRVRTKDELKQDELLVKQYFPESDDRPFLSFHSFIHSYLSSKLGADY